MCESFKEVCRDIGLLKDDMEWRQVLEESSVTRMCPEIRELFCQPSNPRELFEDFWDTWIDDFEQQGKRKKIDLDRNQLMTMLLLDLEMCLQAFEKEFRDFGLPKPTEDDLCRVQFIANTEPVLIREEKDYSVEELSSTVQEKVQMFTPEQLKIFEDILEAVKGNKPLCGFIDAGEVVAKHFCSMQFLQLSSIVIIVHSHTQTYIVIRNHRLTYIVKDSYTL